MPLYFICFFAVTVLHAAQITTESYIDFISHPQSTVNNKSNAVILNCTVGQYFVNGSIYKDIVPANITWFRNDERVNANTLLSKEHLFPNGSFKVYPRTYRISNIRNSDVYQCEARCQNVVLRSQKAQVQVASKSNIKCSVYL